VAAVKGDIRAIDALMQQNRENLKNLSEKLKSSSGKNDQLQRLVQNLDLTIKEKDREIVLMLGQLEDLNYEVQDLYSSVSDLKLENLEQDRIINLQDAMMNAAWYIIATSKELMEKNIIDKEGGIIGIGAVKTLSPDIDPDLFTKIDIRKKTKFDLDAKKVTLVSNHPADSYIIRLSEDTKRYSSFEIVKPDDFWNTTKYMVLSIKE
jgi:predicted RNase H-like nuclease (RuvC/YqgF family)